MGRRCGVDPRIGLEPASRGGIPGDEGNGEGEHDAHPERADREGGVGNAQSGKRFALQREAQTHERVRAGRKQQVERLGRHPRRGRRAPGGASSFDGSPHGLQESGRAAGSSGAASRGSRSAGTPSASVAGSDPYSRSRHCVRRAAPFGEGAMGRVAARPRPRLTPPVGTDQRFPLSRGSAVASLLGAPLGEAGWQLLLPRIAQRRVRNGPGRREPRAIKRQPKPRSLLNLPRRWARTICHRHERRTGRRPTESLSECHCNQNVLAPPAFGSPSLPAPLPTSLPSQSV